MAIHHNDTLANTRLQDIIDAIGSGGFLVIGTSALAGGSPGTLVTFALASPAGTKAARVLTLSGVPLTAVASAGGIAAKAELRTSAGVLITNGFTVGVVGSACDIIVDTTSIVNGRTAFLLAMTITHP